MIKIKTIKDISELNDNWDYLANCIYKKKLFLKVCNDFNYCNQEYYELYKDDVLICGAVSYKLRLNLFTYSIFKLKKDVRIIGVPCSVSQDGFVGDSKYFNEIIDYLIYNKKGLILILNFNYMINNDKMVSGKTLPSLVMENKFNSFDEYLSNIRRNQRRRINKVLEKGKDLTFNRTSCLEFNEEHYKLYENVLNNSNAKLEKLSFEFFKNLPNNFLLNSIYIKDKLIAWHITFIDNKTFYFFLGGVDYNMNKELSSYFNLTIDILKLYLQSDCLNLDLGQTAEIPKMYIGGKIKEKYMFTHHSNKFINFLLKRFKGILEYKYNFKELDIFK